MMARQMTLNHGLRRDSSVRAVLERFVAGAIWPRRRRRLTRCLSWLVWIASGLAWIYFIPFCAAAQESKPPEASMTERDFRARPFRYKEEIEEGKLTPFVDRQFLSARIDSLLRMVGPWDRQVPSPEAHFRPTRPLSYHVVIRYEAPVEKSGFVDVHIPDLSEAGPSAKAPQEGEIYQRALEATLARIVTLAELTPEGDENRADLLIHINLAERFQTSDGFTYENMSQLPKRTTQTQFRSDLETFEYILPWSIVRLYLHRPDYTRPNNGNQRSIEGGEIWIQYPKRTFWQAEVAQAGLDDPKLGARLGIGVSRESILSRFRTPHRTALQSLKEALIPSRPRVWLGAGGITTFSVWTAPRPGESLLSIATGALQPWENALDGAYGDTSGRCGETVHSEVLAARMGRAMTIFVAGVEAGALRVAPLGDYTSEFEHDPDALLADFSIASYQGGFDQRLDDRLVMMSLEELRAAHQGKPLQDLPRSLSLAKSRVTERRIEDIRMALRDIAISFTEGGGCMLFRNLVPPVGFKELPSTQ
jgi:hypothetical protein